MPKRTVRLYDTVRIPALDKSPDKVKFLNDNFFAPQRDSSLVVRIAATHAGLITKNNGFYLPDKMQDGAASMLSPYPKPILLHHDSHSDPVGRILAADYVSTGNVLFQKDSKFKDFIDPKKSFISKVGLVDQLFKDGYLTDNNFQGLGYVSVVAKITDPEAIAKITDNRYMTVSIGATTDRAVCSICKIDWVDEGPCDHRPGKTYEDKPAFIIAGKLEYEELSFVNSPADPFARVIEVQNSADDIQKIQLEADSKEDECITDEAAQVYLITDDKHFAANLLTNKNGETTEEGVKELLKEIEEAEDNVEDHSSEEASVINAGGRHQHLVDSPTGAHYHESDEELPGDHTHTDDNKEGLHFHYVGEDPSGPHEHDGTNPMGVHEHPEEDLMGDDIDEQASGLDNANAEGDSSHRSPQSSSYTGKRKKGKKKKQVMNSKENTVTQENTQTSQADADNSSQLEDKASAALQSLTVQDVANAETFSAKLKEAYPFYTDAQLKEAVESIQTEAAKAGFENKSDNIFNVIHKILGIIEDRDFNADEMYAEMEKVIDELGLSTDAKLSTTKRKSLPSSTFCGPNRSFPVPDCAHVTAARRLIGRAKVSSATKSRILACVSRKAKALGCGGDSVEKQDNIQVAQVISTPASTVVAEVTPPPAADVTATVTQDNTVKDTTVTDVKCNCDELKKLSNEQLEAAFKFITAEAEERKLTFAKQETTTSAEPNNIEIEEKLVSENKELKEQLSALRSELKDVYGDCGDLETSKAGLLEKLQETLNDLHKERASRVCDLRVMSGEIKDKADLEKQLSEEVGKASEVVKQSLKDMSTKVDVFAIADKVNNGMANNPVGAVENPTLSSNEEGQKESNVEHEKIRVHYKNLLANEGQRKADSYRKLVISSGIVPKNFKF